MDLRLREKYLPYPNILLFIIIFLYGCSATLSKSPIERSDMGMDQYLLIPFLVG